MNYETKICTRCDLEKQSSEFHKNRTRTDGLAAWCKNCNNQTTRERDRNRSQQIKNSGPIISLQRAEKKCPGCEVVLPIEQFYPNKYRRDGRRSKCMYCEAEIAKRERASLPKKSKTKRLKAETNCKFVKSDVMWIKPWVKRCVICDTIQDLSNFHIDNGKHLFIGRCKLCCAKISKQKRDKKVKEFNGVTIFEKKCPVCKLIKDSSCFTIKREKTNGLSSYCKRCVAEIHKKVCRERYLTDVEFKLVQVLRSRMFSAIKSANASKKSRSFELLGCTGVRAKIWLENQFLPGMNWDNHGAGEGYWNIDHELPIAMFNISDPNEQKRAFHYTNLQPIWSRDNLSKSDSYLESDCTLSSLYRIFDPDLEMF